MRLFYSLVFLALFLAPLSAQDDVSGSWYTILDAMGTKLPIGLEIENNAGAYAGAMLSPSQTKAKIRLAAVTFEGKKFSAKETQSGVTIDAILDGKELRGIFSQANQDFPIVFTRHRPQAYPIEEGPITITARPQDPKDFPYQRTPVTFTGGAEDITLAGELTLPSKGTPKAAIVLVSGSGPQDRNAYLGSQINHSPFLVLSDYLTRLGYAVLRYDERGVGESTGDFRSSTTDDFALDATAAVAHLRTLKEMKNVPIGVAGHSEGGMIAPVVASRDEALDFVILLAAPAVSIDSLMLDQRRQVGRSMGQPEILIRRDEPALRAAYAWIKDNSSLSQEDYVEGLYGVFEEQLKNLPAALAINGLLDTQVDGMTNLNAIAEIMAINGNKDVTITPLLGLNHLFQPAETGSPTEYGTISTTFDPTALEAIGGWLEARFID